jgi:NAD(P)-dependent dehydrogenase (short-subunit alcohol dehydrogenase family)
MSNLRGKVVVITGASSGIGRRAATLCAERGALPVLAARRADALEEVAAECRRCGAQALIVPTDVTSEDQAAALAQAALDAYGRIDVWVNNAGVTLFALLEQAPFAEHRRVIETNLFGSMLCARALIPIFRRQRRGILINVGSILSKVGQPFVPSYVISKFGLHGLTEVLRTEFADEPAIHVCALYPYAVDTQHFQAGANWLGRQARAMPPVQSTEAVARALVELAEHPTRQRHVPRIAVLGLALHRLMPTTVERLLLHALRRWHFDGMAQEVTEGNLHEPDREPPAVRGDRPPQANGLSFAVWTLAELLRIQARTIAARIMPRSDDGAPLTP